MTGIFKGSAPGRVNLIGEHTDYNGGFVLPTAIPQRTLVTLHPHGRDIIEASAASRLSSYRLGKEKNTGTWIDYIQGISATLREAGFSLTGARIRIESTVPEGSGLSSSAALSVALLKAWRQALSLDLPDMQIARLAQISENNFVGARVGIMDPMAVCFAPPGHALFLDTRSLEFESIPIPENLQIYVINSGISHRNVASGGYNQRRAECEQACERLQVTQIRDLTPEADLSSLPEVLQRRVKHVLKENQRVCAAAIALKQGQSQELGRLMMESHQSQKDDYEVSVPEIDYLVALCLQTAGFHGARLTGGGFGGSIVAIGEREMRPSALGEILRRYESYSGEKATILVPMQPPSFIGLEKNRRNEMKKEKGKKAGGKVIPFKPKPARINSKSGEKVAEQVPVNLPPDKL